MESSELRKRAEKLIPGGVNSPVRSFAYVESEPVYVDSANGPFIKTVDGQQLIDFVMSWGAIILGHSNEFISSNLKNEIDKGLTYGLNHRKEVEFCEILKSIFPNSKFRIMNSGTEATMTSVRLARGFTGKKYIIKFSGCFHGHADQFLTSAGSGMATLSIQSSAGVPQEFVSCTITLDFNADDELIKDAFRKYEIAGVILEPIPANMGIVPPEKRFLKSIFEECRKNSALVIFDEIVSGFRVSWGGITRSKKIRIIMFDSKGEREEEIDVDEPDITTFGKAVGGGMPIGIVRANEKIMELLAPTGPVYQAGTFSANPITISAGISLLRFISSYEGDFYENLREKTKTVFNILKDWSTKKGIAVSIVASTGMLSLFFSESVPRNFDEVKKTDTNMFKKLFKHLLGNGILIPPSPHEAWFISIAHSENEFEKLKKSLEKF